jgi:predicted membrane chloride channel (bestrophin family)
MIDYYKGIYNINLLFRIHGSSLYKSSLLGLFSTILYLALNFKIQIPIFLPLTDDDLDHPYGVGVLVSSVGFLIVFRANYSYRRYWDGVSYVHNMLSKWGDVAVNASVFAYQNDKWDGMKPRTWYDFEELNRSGTLTRERRRGGSESQDGRMVTSVFDYNIRNDRENAHHDSSFASTAPSSNGDCLSPTHTQTTQQERTWNISSGTNTSSDIHQRLANNNHYFPCFSTNSNFAHRPNGKTPPLFLQELAHRASLLTAVALSTLRNDSEGYESPLDVYIPSAAFPEVDPDKLPSEMRKIFQPNVLMRQIRYSLGLDRLPARRADYNMTRPLSVIGGVSDAEIAFLQKARGGYAKTQLAWSWLSEFIVREHLAGTLGDVHAAILSRLFQNISDGMLNYNRARQIVCIPFPFPHAQLSVFYTLILVPVIPFLMDQFTNVRWVGAILTFFAITCLVGLHEVAREMESPFRNVPNEVPLVTMQARFNEGLFVMFSGYNPDGFWDGEGWLRRIAEERNLRSAAGENGGDATAEAPNHGNDTRHVRFASHVGTNSQVARDLRDILNKQAKEIEQLVKLIDECEKPE